MDLDDYTIRDRCTEAVFDRGRRYRADDRIRQLDRFGDRLTAKVRGSSLYDVTIDLDGPTITARCTCPDNRTQDCKHVVAALLEAAENPPPDEHDRVETLLGDASVNELRTFVSDALERDPALRDRFIARLGDTARPLDAYRAELADSFDERAQDGSLITTSIDFSRYLDVADRYRDRDRPLAAATVYRALFEAIDDNMHRVDAGYDHYDRTFQTALDGYVECVLASDLDAKERDDYGGVLAARMVEAAPSNRERFQRALDEFEN